MPKTIILGVLIFVSLNTLAQEFNFPEPDQLKMKITIMDDYINSIKTGDTSSVSFYDLKGNLRKVEHRIHGLVYSNFVYNYDDKNRIIEYIDKGRREFKESGHPYSGQLAEVSMYSPSIMERKEYTYESDQLKKVDSYEFGDDLMVSQIFEYNGKGNVAKETVIRYPNPNTEIFFNPNSTEIDWEKARQDSVIIESKIYIYNGEVRICEHRQLDSLFRIDSAYYENGLIQRMVTYQNNGNKTFEAFYEYDHNRLISCKTISSATEILNDWSELPEFDGIALGGHTKFIYDRDGYLVAKEYYENKNLATRTRYEYIYY